MGGAGAVIQRPLGKDDEQTETGKKFSVTLLMILFLLSGPVGDTFSLPT